MKKLSALLSAMVVSVGLLSTTALAAPTLVGSATEPDRPVVTETPSEEVEIDNPDVPLADLPETPETPSEEVEIDNPDVPLADVPSPQTGVTGLSGMETMGLLAASLTAGGALVLVKARQQTGSAR